MFTFPQKNPSKILVDQRVKSNEKQVKSNEQRAKCNEQRAKSNEQRTKSNEQRAKSNEQRVTIYPNDLSYNDETWHSYTLLKKDPKNT